MMINLFEDFILERISVNDAVIKYTNQITDKLRKENSDFFIDLVSSNDLKLRNLKIKIIRDNTNKATILINNRIIDNKFIDNAIIEIHIKDVINDIIISNINHELNHALEVYKTSINNRKINKSWRLKTLLDEHKKCEKYNGVWDDFIYIIYLTLKHEINSHISDMYHQLIDVDNTDKELLNNDNYKKCLFYLNVFTIDVFYRIFKQKYTDEDFIFLTKDFCKKFNFKEPKTAEECKILINDIILSSKRKLLKYKNKIEKVVKRIKEDKNTTTYESITYIKNIDYDKYI